MHLKILSAKCLFFPFFFFLTLGWIYHIYMIFFFFEKPDYQ